MIGRAFILLLAAGTGAAAETPVQPPLEQVVGPWVHTGQDCNPDNHFDMPANLPGSSFTLAPDYTYTLAMEGEEPSGTFTLKHYESEDIFGEAWLVVLEQAELPLILNIDRLETWYEEPVEQCTQLFERPQ